jgi:hypothetical protein
MSKSQTRQRSGRKEQDFILKAELVEQVDVYSDESGVYPLTHYRNEDSSYSEAVQPSDSETPDLFQEGRLRSRQIDDLSDKGMSLCGYLREPYLEGRKPTGLCALCDLKPCNFQRFVYSSGKNNCPTHNAIIQEMIERERRRS